MSQYRTHTCGELRAADAGKTVTLAGWMENVREVGSNFAFVVLRDFYGTTQIVVDSAEMMKTVKGINKESTIAVTGTAAPLVTATRGADGNLTIVTKPATSYDTTTANVTLTQEGSGKKVTITVTIAGKADDGVFTASPTTLTFAPEGGTKTSTITSTSKGKTVGWTVKDKSSLPSWLSVSGEGTSTLSVTTKPNE